MILPLGGTFSNANVNALIRWLLLPSSALIFGYSSTINNSLTFSGVSQSLEFIVSADRSATKACPILFLTPSEEHSSSRRYDSCSTATSSWMWYRQGSGSETVEGARIESVFDSSAVLAEPAAAAAAAAGTKATSKRSALRKNDPAARMRVV